MITVVHLTKFHGSHLAVSDLSFTVPRGTIFGFIGPNGAGKTSTMRVLATLSPPTAGTAFLCGHDVRREQMAIRRLLGYMPDQFGFYPGMRVGEHLDFFGAAHRISPSRRQRVIADVLALTDLEPKRDDFIDTLSQGNRQRVCLARTLIHDPQVLILDEPASGLDPRARLELRELLKTLRSMGKTILISSHILSDLADFSDQIGIIERGHLIAVGSVLEMQRMIRPHRVVEWRLLDGTPTAAAWLRAQIAVATVDGNDGHLRVTGTFSDDDLARYQWELMQRGARILTCREIEASLEEVFLQTTQGGVS